MSTGSPGATHKDARGMRFAICATRWNLEVVEQMLAGAQRALATAGAADVRVYRCAGAFELAALSARVAKSGSVDGVVALGCLIRGGTDHYQLLSQEATRALGQVALEGAVAKKPVAVAFGVLTCDTEAQAQERADPARSDKGGEAAQACIEQVHALREVD